MVADLIVYEEGFEKVARGHLLELKCITMLKLATSETKVARQILMETPWVDDMDVTT